MANTPVEKKPIKDLLAEKDAFLTSSDRLYEYFLRHTKAFIVAAVAVAACLIAWAAYNKYAEGAENKAMAAYEKALEAAAESPAKASEALEAMRVEFSGRKAARMAAYALVSLYSAQSENAKALALSEELLRTLPPIENALKPVLLSNVAGLYAAENKLDEAAATYESILKLGIDQPTLRCATLMSLARTYAAQGKTEDAIRNYQLVISDFPAGIEAYTANNILASLTGQPRAFPGSVPAELTAANTPESAPAPSENETNAE